MSNLSNWKNCRMMLILTLLRKLLLFTIVIPLGLSQTWIKHCNLLNQPHRTLSLTNSVCFFMFSASVLFIYQNMLVSLMTGKGTLWISTNWTQLCTSLKEAVQGKQQNELCLVNYCSRKHVALYCVSFILYDML